MHRCTGYLRKIDLSSVWVSNTAFALDTAVVPGIVLSLPRFGGMYMLLQLFGLLGGRYDVESRRFRFGGV